MSAPRRQKSGNVFPSAYTAYASNEEARRQKQAVAQQVLAHAGPSSWLTHTYQHAQTQDVANAKNKTGAQGTRPAILARPSQAVRPTPSSQELLASTALLLEHSTVPQHRTVPLFAPSTTTPSQQQQQQQSVAAEGQRNDEKKEASAKDEDAGHARAETTRRNVLSVVNAAHSAIKTEAIKPLRTTLAPPLLGRAVGSRLPFLAECADQAGGVASVSMRGGTMERTAKGVTSLQMSESEGAALRAQEQAAYAELFDWWSARQGVRAEAAAYDYMDNALQTKLQDSLARLLTQEEGRFLCEHAAVAQGHGTTRGVTTPLPWLTRLFVRTRRAMHEQVIAILQDYHAVWGGSPSKTTPQEQQHEQQRESKNGKEVEGSTGVPIQPVVKAYLESERALLQLQQHEQEKEQGGHANNTAAVGKMSARHTMRSAHSAMQQQQQSEESDGGRGGGEGDVGSVLPSSVSCVTASLPMPVVGLETALAVTWLWKILEQIRSVLPGAELALRLYLHYILPHLYEHWGAYEAVLPQLGGLSEQVMQLAGLPLRLQRNRWALQAVAQCKEDVRYMEYAMQRWALRTWRSSVLNRRRRETKVGAMGGLLRRLQHRLNLRAVFDAWRFEARERAHFSHLQRMSERYHSFLTGPHIMAQVDTLNFLGQPQPGSRGRHTPAGLRATPGAPQEIRRTSATSAVAAAMAANARLSKTKYIALRLCEAAQHEESFAKRQSGGRGKDGGVSNNNSNKRRGEVDDKAVQTSLLRHGEEEGGNGNGEEADRRATLASLATMASTATGATMMTNTMSTQQLPYPRDELATRTSDNVATATNDTTRSEPPNEAATSSFLPALQPHRGAANTTTATPSSSSALRQSKNSDTQTRTASDHTLPAVTAPSSMAHSPRPASLSAHSQEVTMAATSTRAEEEEENVDEVQAEQQQQQQQQAAASAQDERSTSALHHAYDEEGAAAVKEGAAGGGMHLQRQTLRIFEEMLDKLQEMEEVCYHLQGEVAIQANRTRLLERENAALKERNHGLEADLLRTVDEKLHYCNLVQEKQFELNDRDRRILQLKSRLRAHRNRPWQRVLMRVTGELCQVSTQVAEEMDELRLQRDLASSTDHTNNGSNSNSNNHIGANTNNNTSGNGGVTSHNASLTTRPTQTAVAAAASGAGGGASNATASAVSATAHMTSQQADALEQQRLFGKLAPIVLASTQHLPDALTILQDWANGCLNDLESLDDLKGGALSVRFSTFSEEARNGVLLSRLLFYLALPRYLQRTAQSNEQARLTFTPAAATAAVAASATGGERKNSGSGHGARKTSGVAESAKQSLGSSYPDRRRQLLQRCNVQLDSPFPIYAECFGDLLNLRPSERMTLLLQFATELMVGPEWNTLHDDFDAVRERLREEVYSHFEAGGRLGAAGRLELQEVIDPHALAMGERASVVTFIALLYTRFAHPFNHKARQTAEMEKAAIVYLLSDGKVSPAGNLPNNNNNNNNSSAGNASGNNSGGKAGKHKHHNASNETSKELTSVTAAAENGGSIARAVAESIMAQLDDEDKTPWQLFKERCLPYWGTAAHPFLLRGNFWPSDAFDSPDLAELLGELGMALNRSLQIHRWHITLACLVPVMTYSGLSRGVFTGARASPTALRIGLEREHHWVIPLHSTCLTRVYVRRARQLRRAVAAGVCTVQELDATATTSAGAAMSGENEMASMAQDTPVTAALAAAEPQTNAAAAAPVVALRSNETSSLLSPEPTQSDITTKAAAAGAAGASTTTPTKRVGSAQSVSSATSELNEAAFVHKEKLLLMDTLRVVSTDLLMLFLRFSTLSAELALPTLDLGGWRLLCADLRLISLDPEQEAQAPLDMERVTRMFYDAVLALNEAEASSAAPVVMPTTTTTGATTANTGSAAHGGATSPAARPFSGDTSVTNTATNAAVTRRVGSAGTAAPFTTSASTGAHAAHVPSHATLVPLPRIMDDMTYTAFLTAVVLLADTLFPPAPALLRRARNASIESSLLDTTRSLSTLEQPPPPAPQQQAQVTDKAARPIIWLADALRRFVFTYVTTNPMGSSYDDPRTVIRRLTMGVDTQEVLASYTPAIILVFNAYSKDLYGAAGMEKEDLLRLLRDAMLTSTEISQYLVFELFQHCCVTRRAIEEEAAARRRELDGRPRDAQPQRGRRGQRAVSIVDPRMAGSVTSSTTTTMTSPATTMLPSMTGRTRELQVLVYEGFVQLLCLLCSFKQPNPLIPFDQRLSVFLRRLVLRPLVHKVENLAPLLNRARTRRGPAAENNNTASGGRGGGGGW